MLFAILARKEQVPHAFLLARTIKKHHPNARMALCLVEYYLPFEMVSEFDEVLLISGQGFPKKDPANGGPTKAYFIKYLLNRYVDDILYLDPETIVYSPFEEVISLLNRYPIIAAPFNLEPVPKDLDSWEIERLRNGFIHSGFLALKHTDHSKQFVDWWSKRVNRTTFGPAKSNAADHMWLSLGAVPFGIHILKEPGYQVAQWNWHEQARSITHVDRRGVYFQNGKQLRSFATTGALERLQNPIVPIPDQTRSTFENMLCSDRLELERIRQTLP